MWDHELFLWMNFDGGRQLDSIMQFASGHLSWVPLYALILGLIWRANGWRKMLLALLCIAIAVGVSDIIAGIFKHSGLLKGLLPDFPVRLRPMHTDGIKELTHFLRVGGQYGTVSAHAATALSVGIVATYFIRRWWFGVVMLLQVALVCYSRIYLGYHFPQDILLGILVGSLSSIAAVVLYTILERCKNR